MNTPDMHIPSNKVRDIERYFHAELDAQYGKDEVGMFVRMLFEEYVGWNLAQLLTHRDDTINQSDLLRFHWAVEELRRWRPIQHIVGWTEFCGCHIEVDESTLIPRPETEEIVNWTINHFSEIKKQYSKIRVLDLCTGSGCIAIALAKQWPDAEVTAVDISDKALSVAQRNAETNSVNVNFLQADILRFPFSVLRSPFSLIISNPPYIRQCERGEMRRNVLDWEPNEALFVPDEDPLIFYRAIARIAKASLSDDGLIVVEINEKMGEATAQLLEQQGFSSKIDADSFGKQRRVIGHRRTITD